MKVGIIGGGISGVSLALKLGILKEQGKEIDGFCCSNTFRNHFGWKTD